MENHPDQYLPLHTIHFSDKFKLKEGQKKIFEDVVSWRITPPLVKTGRSTYLLIKDTEVPFKGVKIKGCGFFDIQNNSVMQPSTEDGYDSHVQHAPDGIKEIHYQIEVNDQDEPFYSIPKKRPYGGQIFTRAKLEFDATSHLFNKWDGKKELFPFYFPVGYARYKNLFYKDEPLGVTILGIPGEKETPLGNYFMGQFEDNGLRINPHVVAYWQKHIAPTGKENPDYFDLLTTIKGLCYEFSKTMKYLHKHFVDHDSHLFNAMVNGENGKVVFFDLDHVLSVKEISAQKYFYYALKDFEIGLVGILSNFLLSGLLDGIVLFEKSNQPADNYNPIEGFFSGYFGYDNEVAKQDAKNIWNRTIEFALDKLMKAPRKDQFNMAYNFCEQERKRSYIDTYRYLKNDVKTMFPNFELTPEKHAKIIGDLFEQRLSLESTDQQG
ncbi:hypothetical protein C0416_04860 [bacterium]|nr:hypothetical protein [bacterium]